MATNDLQAYGTDPGTQYTPSTAFPPPNPPYNEDRQVTLSGGPGTQMYRTVNAYFSQAGQVWHRVDTGAQAFATVQNPDGSIHFYTLNTSTGLWEGSDNNTVYNALDFGMVPTTINPTFDNGPVFQNLFDTLIAAGGGTIVVPSGKYNFASGVSHTAISPEDSGVLIVGTGGGAEFSANFESNETLFSFTDFSSTGNGIRFHNLRLTNASGASVTAIGIALSQCLNITCHEVYFYNWSQAFSTDAASGQCGLVDCTIQYVTGQTGQTMVSLQGSQDFIRSCVIMENTSGPSGCYGIAMAGTNGIYIDNVHISDFDYGMKLTDGLRDSFVSNTLIDAQVCAVQIMPSDELHKVTNICFSNCVFAENESTAGSGAPGNSGVIITTNGGADTHVTGIVFNNCIAYGWGAAGIEIDYGQNIVISGGQFSSNGQSTNASANLRAGIAIAGGTMITISGADCSGINQRWQDNGSGATTQPTGIAISDGRAAVSDVTITGCNLQANATNGVLVAQSLHAIDTITLDACNLSYASFSTALAVTGTPTKIRVTNCAGYNDQNETVSTVNPTTGISASDASTLGSGAINYYGPSMVTGISNATTATHLHISGTSYLVPTSSFFCFMLGNPTDQWFVDHTPPNFTWLGK